MAISITRYVDIVSGVVAGVRVLARELIGRVITTNPLLPPRTLVEFDSADEVALFFGSTSKEYKRAAFYFGWISKNATRAKKLGFYRWVDAAVKAFIYGGKGNQVLATWQAILDGAISITMGVQTFVLSAMDFSGALTLSDVAAIIQSEVNGASVDPEWATATVTWDSVNKQFILTGGLAGNVGGISAQTAGVGTEIITLMKWSVVTGAVFSDSSDVETVTDMLITSADISNNFGSFCFNNTPTAGQALEAAIWNQNQNIRYMFSLMSSTDGSDTSLDDFMNAGLMAYGGVAVAANTPGEFIDMFPMMIMAATDYTRRASVQNYMYQIDDRLTPTATTDSVANYIDNLRINYYGQTQQAGKKINFYQRGVLWGMPSSPADMNVYANEMWLKDAATVNIMSLLLNLARLSANASGRAKLLNTLQDVIDLALFNGTISVGKPLNNAQKTYITEETGDPLAFYQVHNLGYWLDCEIIQVGIEYIARYTLIYSKDDIIRKVEGSHQLI